MPGVHTCRYNMVPQRELDRDQSLGNDDCDDRKLLLGSLADFNAESHPEGRKTEAEKFIIRGNQRRFLMVIAMGVPTVKFLTASSVVFIMAYNDTIGYDLRHPNQTKDGGINKNETIYLSTLSYIPMSAISLLIGFLTFSKYPKVTNTAINHFLLYNFIILFIQICIIIILVARLHLSQTEHMIAHSVTITEGYFLVLIKVCVNRRYEGPNSPNDIEMKTIPREPNNQNSSDTPIAGPSGTQTRTPIAGPSANDPPDDDDDDDNEPT